LMRTLDELKLSDNTIVVFFSDNGGVHWAPERGQAKEDFGDTPITSNAPLRGGKAMIYEGGTREPCVVVWPGVVKPGSKSDALIQSIDFHPTILAMLGLKPKENLKFDGMSIVPALRGEPLGRDTIFCHFPHNVKVNGNLPATYVRKGDWKLIRIYCDNDDQTNRFELYNLKDDESETKNLADRMPEKVKELDALIERHVKEIGAVVPKPNPAYRRGAQDEAAGWKAGGTCSLAAKDGVLRVTSTGGDPNIVTNQTPDCSGPLLFKVRMKCATKGAGEVRWTDAEVKTFGRIAYVSFPIQHDGQWHEYEAQMTVKGKLASLRLDPGAAEGEIEIAWIRLVKPDGTALKEWKF
ncbi:MAG: sulfatase-like hydrolase/transferase, partial [Candidatus Sumerlaeota bacterium]|nr:sulfatase-like hydrolase/transferase [Candidatus Sumerlaeota bacterium]